MKRSVALILTSIILLSNISLAVPVQKKNETVYVNLDSYGNVSQINIYSKWLTNGAAEIIDYTKYIEISNLTNRKNEIKAEDAIIWDVTGDKTFTYTGKVGEDYYSLLPWNFNISYKLNGAEVMADELVGAKGLVKITIDITSNKQANSYYLNNYILELTGSYDMSKYISVESEDAMITDTGNTKTLMFIVLPGQSKTFSVEIGTDNFSMDGITMALVPITGDIRDQVVNLIEDKDKIKNAIDSLDSSSDIVLSAMSGMTNGLNGVTTGIKEIKNGTNDLNGLKDIRNKDIEQFRTILNELLPLFQDIQMEIDDLNKNYKIITELNDELNNELKNLSDCVNELNDNLDDINMLMNNLPNDVEEINNLLKATANVISQTKRMISKLSGASESSESLENDLTEIGKETQTIGMLVQQTAPNVTDEDTQTALLQIGKSANSIGKSLKSVQNTLEKMSSNTISGTSSFESSLDKLQKELNSISEICSKKDAKKFVNLMDSITETSDSIEKSLNTIVKYNDELIANKDDVTKSIGTMKQLVEELNKINVLSLQALDNVQKTLNIIDNDFYGGTNETLDAIASVNNQMVKITSQTSQIKKAKDDLKNVVDDKVDEIENKTTLWNLEKDVEVVSFGSEKNENVESVQFILKTPDIKNIKKINEDLETESEPKTFWEKVVFLFKKIFDWLINIFD